MLLGYLYLERLNDSDRAQWYLISNDNVECIYDFRKKLHTTSGLLLFVIPYTRNHAEQNQRGTYIITTYQINCVINTQGFGDFYPKVIRYSTPLIEPAWCNTPCHGHVSMLQRIIY